MRYLQSEEVGARIFSCESSGSGSESVRCLRFPGKANNSEKHTLDSDYTKKLTEVESDLILKVKSCH